MTRPFAVVGVSLAAVWFVGMAAGSAGAAFDPAGRWHVTAPGVAGSVPQTVTFTATGPDTYTVTNGLGYSAPGTVVRGDSATAHWDTGSNGYGISIYHFESHADGPDTFTGTYRGYYNNGAPYTPLYPQAGTSLSIPTSLSVAVSLAKSSLEVGGKTQVDAKVTATGGDVSGISLSNGLVASSDAAKVSRSPTGLNGFDLAKGTSRSFAFELTGVKDGTVKLRVEASGRAGSREVHGSAEATVKVVEAALSVVDVTRGTGELSADVRVKFGDSSSDTSGCDPKASYEFTDPQLASAKEVAPCSYELTFDAPGTGIYHVALKATDSSGAVTPLSIDQYGATVDGEFTLIIDSCSDPEDDVRDVDALVDSDDGLCAVAVGQWDSDATGVAAKVLASVESSPTPEIDPISVDSIDPSDWPSSSKGLAGSGSTDTGWVPIGTNEPPYISATQNDLRSIIGGDAAVLARAVHLPPLPAKWTGASAISTPIADCHVNFDARPPGVVISAHGLWYPPNGLVRVPAGDEISTYVPIGTIMAGCLGLDIDTGKIHGADTKYLHVYTAGQLIPNFTFIHYDGEHGKHVETVDGATTLNALIRPNEGQISISACASLYMPDSATVAQTLSSVPIHTPGTAEAAETSRVTITKTGEIETSAASGNP